MLEDILGRLGGVIIFSVIIPAYEVRGFCCRLELTGEIINNGLAIYAEIPERLTGSRRLGRCRVRSSVP